MAAIKRYTMIDSDGNSVGFYSDDIWKVIPDGAIEITEDQYQQWLTGQSANPPQRYQLVNGVLVTYNPPAPSLTPQQNYDAAIAAGLAVTSASSVIPFTRLAVTPAQQTTLANVALYIQVNSKFPGGQEALALTKTNGELVQIPSTDAWMAIANAVADYVTLCDVALITASNGSWVAPSNAVTIA